MAPFSIAEEIKTKIPGIAVGWITATVKIVEHCESLWREIDAASIQYCGTTMTEARKLPPIKKLRDAYRSLGVDPTRYRGANEALVRRIVQGKSLYHVNSVVDINNLVSLETLYSGGTFDRTHIRPPIVFRIGQPGECYSGIGRGEIKLDGLPVFADQLGPFGSTTSDSERTMVQLNATEILMVLISFFGTANFDAVVQRAVHLLKQYAEAAHVDSGIVE
jgi:DNA/RNA-binding domain of Phe-tRNA-synthetase-like protein